MVKVVYMQIMLQCLLVWIALVRYRLAEPMKKKRMCFKKSQKIKGINGNTFILTMSCVALPFCHFLKVPYN